jgi:hypothetical protein
MTKEYETDASVKRQVKAFLEGKKPAVLFMKRDSLRYLPSHHFTRIEGQGDIVVDSRETLGLVIKGKLGLALGYGVSNKCGSKILTVLDNNGDNIVDIMTDGRVEIENAALKIGASFKYRSVSDSLAERQDVNK